MGYGLWVRVRLGLLEVEVLKRVEGKRKANERRLFRQNASVSKERNRKMLEPKKTSMGWATD